MSDPEYANVDHASDPMRKKQVTAIALGLWLMIISALMLYIRLFDLEIFFVVGFVGFLVLVELLEPRYVQPGTLRYKNYLLAAGIIIFFGIVTQAIQNFLHL
jgi:hypothetical protein